MTNALSMQSSANEYMLRRLYDPHYVHRVISDGAPVQVCIDGRMLGVRGTGVAVYAEVLASCLKAAGARPAALNATNTRHERGWVSRIVRGLSALKADARRAISHDVSQSDHQKTSFDDVWSASDLFREAQVFFTIHGRLMPVACAAPPKVMHWTYPVPLYLQGAKNIYTIHDLIPLKNPELSPVAFRRHARLIGRLAEVANRFVTVSETSREELVAYLGCAPEHVVNTYQAVHAPLQRDPPLPEDLAPGRYLLFCGSVEPRKNIARLIDAYRSSSVDLPLVILGPDGPNAEDINRQIRATPSIRRIDWQPRPAAIGLIRQARALCFPSLAEGFGLPVAEAMTLGTPVMTSNIGALAEISGGATLMVDPFDVEDIASTIRSLVDDDALCSRLRALGFERSRLFSKAVYVERLRTLYAEVQGPWGREQEESVHARR
jgi:glycosyltransferase involved in cell wall biosynthesis